MVETLQGDLRISTGTAIKLILKRAWKTVGVLLLVMVVAWVGLSVTFARALFTSSMGAVMSVTPRFESGALPTGEQVFIDQNADGSFTLIDNIRISVTYHQTTILAEIVEGPYGDVDYESYGLEGFEGALSSQYIVRCIDGACQAGEYYLANERQIIGVPAEIGGNPFVSGDSSTEGSQHEGTEVEFDENMPEGNSSEE